MILIEDNSLLEIAQNNLHIYRHSLGGSHNISQGIL